MALLSSHRQQAADIGEAKKPLWISENAKLNRAEGPSKRGMPINSVDISNAWMQDDASQPT